MRVPEAATFKALCDFDGRRVVVLFYFPGSFGKIQGFLKYRDMVKNMFEASNYRLVCSLALDDNNYKPTELFIKHLVDFTLSDGANGKIHGVSRQKMANLRDDVGRERSKAPSGCPKGPQNYPRPPKHERWRGVDFTRKHAIIAKEMGVRIERVNVVYNELQREKANNEQVKPTPTDQAQKGLDSER